MTKARIDDILGRLCDLLESDDLPCRFDIATYGDGIDHTCGTVACAAGLLPVVAPDVFKWDDAGMPRYIKDGYNYYSVLGLKLSQDIHLFVAGCQNIEEYGGKMLGLDAGPKEVASNIRIFLAR